MFPNAWLLLFYQIHTLRFSASHVKSMSIPMYFLQDGKIQQYLSYGTCIDIHTLPKIWVLIFLNHMVGTWIFAGVFGSIAKFTKTHVSFGKTSTLNIWIISLPSNSRPIGYCKKTIYALILPIRWFFLIMSELEN